jgi:dTDP-4-amino-4,6-dideoxygalactose transaminase
MRTKESIIEIPFNKPYMTGKELTYISKAHANGHLAGDGAFTKQCNAWLENSIGCAKAFLTHSCTAALEMAAILIDIKPGDEVIMPSYTFVSTANAFVLRGAIPVFVDIRPDTLNIDEQLIEMAITEKARAIVVVHYAGVGCEMDRIMEIASHYNLPVIEDAAQGIQSSYSGKPLGGIGHLGAISFHETKNIICGEGGALLVNDEKYVERAEIIREKGTNRNQFYRGQVDKYTWVDIGSSYLPGELNAAFLWAQMEDAVEITTRRLNIWERYHQGLAALENQGKIRRPIVPEACNHNAHMYYLLLKDHEKRDSFIADLKKDGVAAVFHYVPLDISPFGRKVGRRHGELTNTHELSLRLVRLPLWLGLEDHVDRVIHCVNDAVAKNSH